MNSSTKDSYGGSSSGGDSGSDLELGDTKSSESLVNSARSGRDEFDFGDDRAITDTPNWASLDTTALYHSAVDNNDPGSADAMGQTWSNHGAELQRVADELYEAISELGGAWVGQAAGAAQGSLVGIANSSQIAGDAALVMGTRMSEQAMAAAEVKKMPPPSDFDPQTAWESALAAGPAAMALDFWPKYHQAENIKKQQEAYLAAYTKSMTDVDSATPSFGPESLGLKPMAGHQSVVHNVSGPLAPSGAADGGPGLSDARARVDAAASSVQAQAVEHAKGVAHAGGHAAAQVTQQVPGQATAAGPLSATGHAAVSTTSSGPSAAGIGAAALGAGVGLAGARALTKHSRAGRKPGAAPTEQEAAAAEAAAQEAAAAQAAAAEASSAEAAAAQQAVAGAGAVEAAISAMPTGEPVSGASVAASAEPAAGNVASVAQHQAGGSVAAAHGGPAGSGAPGVPGAGGAGAPSAAQLNAMGAMAPGPMTPMGGGAAGLGAGGEAGAGAGAAEEHAPASFLIAPDPDEFFGSDEAVTPTVIGAFDDDDE